MCDQVIECGRQGMAITEMAVELGIDRKTLYRWRGQHPEFATALTRALEASQAWWERAARTGDANEVIGPAIWKHAVNCRFPDFYRNERHENVDAKQGLLDALREIAERSNKAGRPREG